MARFKFLFSRSHILFLVAILTGIFLPQAADFASIYLIYPALTAILTIALLRFPRGFFQRHKPPLSGAVWGNVMNYLVMGNLIIIASYFLIREDGFWVGMVLVAAAPPATTIIPLGNILRIDKQSMFSGMVGAYLGALLIAPLIVHGSLNTRFIGEISLIVAIFMLILLPLFLSWLAVNEDWDKLIENYKGHITDGCFFVIFYALVSSTRYLVIHRPLDVVFMFVIAVVSTFLLGFIINLVGNYYGTAKEKISSLVFLGTMKNYGLAGVIALNFFHKQAALPALVFSVVMFIYTIWLKYKMGNDIVPGADTKSK